MHAAPRGAARAEAMLEIGDEIVRRAHAVFELARELHEAAEVGLPHDLALTELLRRPLDPAGVLRVPAHGGGDDGRRAELLQALEQLPRSLAREQRRALKRDLRVVERFLEIGQPRVGAAEHADLLVRDAAGVRCAYALDDERV